MSTKTKTKNQEPAMPAPALTAVPEQPTLPALEPPKSAVKQLNEHMKWKPRTLGALRHLGEKFPEESKAVAALIAKVNGLPDDYSPSDKAVKPEVGDVVKVPEMESMLKALKLDNRGTVVATERGAATVDIGGHRFTVQNKALDILERAKPAAS